MNASKQGRSIFCVRVLSQVLNILTAENNLSEISADTGKPNKFFLTP